MAPKYLISIISLLLIYNSNVCAKYIPERPPHYFCFSNNTNRILVKIKGKNPRNNLGIIMKYKDNVSISEIKIQSDTFRNMIKVHKIYSRGLLDSAVSIEKYFFNYDRAVPEWKYSDSEIKDADEITNILNHLSNLESKQYFIYEGFISQNYLLEFPNNFNQVGFIRTIYSIEENEIHQRFKVQLFHKDSNTSIDSCIKSDLKFWNNSTTKHLCCDYLEYECEFETVQKDNDFIDISMFCLPYFLYLKMNSLQFMENPNAIIYLDQREINLSNYSSKTIEYVQSQISDAVNYVYYDSVDTYGLHYPSMKSYIILSKNKRKLYYIIDNIIVMDMAIKKGIFGRRRLIGKTKI